MATRTPAALYLATDGLDVRPGKALLRAAGLDVFDVAQSPPATGDLERVVALLVGYDDVGGEWFDRLPALQVVATHPTAPTTGPRRPARRLGARGCGHPRAAG